MVCAVLFLGYVYNRFAIISEHIVNPSSTKAHTRRRPVVDGRSKDRPGAGDGSGATAPRVVEKPVLDWFAAAARIHVRFWGGWMESPAAS